MPKYFTLKGLEHFKLLMQNQRDKVRAIGQEVGDAAGINCDWHDNFAYEDAKRRLELESTMLESMVNDCRDAVIVAPPSTTAVVQIGTTVHVLVNSQKKEFTIGAFGEVDATLGLISYDSPLGSALVGLAMGDETTVQLAGRDVLLEIGAIYPSSHRYNDLVDNLRSHQRIRTVQDAPREGG